jgi:hypothetical protein
VYSGTPVAQVLMNENTPPDFEYNRPAVGSELVWIHRRSDDADIYFVANQRGRSEDVETKYRVAGKNVELWHPDNGKIEPAAYTIIEGATLVPLHLDPYGSVFVVFHGKAPSTSRSIPKAVMTELTRVDGPWDVRFPANWGAPPNLKLESLISWTKSSDSGVKYFSGTATYVKTSKFPRTNCDRAAGFRWILEK